jgi:hypothetical protein
VLPQRLAPPFPPGFQLPLLFETVEERIETPRADSITVTREFFDHPQSETWLFDGMVQHVETYQSRIEVSIGARMILL